MKDYGYGEPAVPSCLRCRKLGLTCLTDNRKILSTKNCAECLLHKSACSISPPENRLSPPPADLPVATPASSSFRPINRPKSATPPAASPAPRRDSLAIRPSLTPVRNEPPRVSPDSLRPGPVRSSDIAISSVFFDGVWWYPSENRRQPFVVHHQPVMVNNRTYYPNDEIPTDVQIPPDVLNTQAYLCHSRGRPYDFGVHPNPNVTGPLSASRRSGYGSRDDRETSPRLQQPTHIRQRSDLFRTDRDRNFLVVYGSNQRSDSFRGQSPRGPASRSDQEQRFRRIDLEDDDRELGGGIDERLARDSRRR